MVSLSLRLDEARRLLKLAAPQQRGLRKVMLNTKRGRRAYWVAGQKKKNDPVLTGSEIQKAAIERSSSPDRFGVIMKAKDFFKRDKPLSKRQREMVKARYDRAYNRDKVEKIMRYYPSISEEEAIGLATFVGSEYGNVNAVLRGEIGVGGLRKKDGIMEQLISIRSPNSFLSGVWVKNKDTPDLSPDDFSGTEIDYYQSIATLAEDCLKKMDTLSPESLERDFNRREELSHIRPEFSPGWGVTRGSKGDIRILGDRSDPGLGKLRRYISVDDKEVAGMFVPGKVFKEPGFMSTSIPTEGHGTYLSPFMRKSNIEMLIDWKKDGSSGKFVDHIKSRGSNVQTEVLYPPNQGFLVESVNLKRFGNESHERVYTVHLKEV